MTVAAPPYIPGDSEKASGTLTISAKQILGF
jgi:hypothetical protein